MELLQLGIEIVERGLFPDAVMRAAVRRLCRQRLQDLRDERRLADQRSEFFRQLRRGPIAPASAEANEQHYELPAEFFAAVLGPRRKYSCCYFEDAQATLAEAEQSALRITCERAELADGQDVLELGCGWGSLSLWMAERYPASRITAVSNSASQRAYIERVAAERGLANLRIITADINDFAAEAGGFDRVVSVEMFEHLQNYERLLGRVAEWLRPDGKLFVHIFCHRRLGYPFETQGAANWMGRYFFTGGIMPSADTLRQFGDLFALSRQWWWNGRHYQRTAEAWLRNLDLRGDEARRILAEVYGKRHAARWLQRWRMFFLAVAEVFGFDGGEQWAVGHYLLSPVGQSSASVSRAYSLQQ